MKHTFGYYEIPMEQCNCCQIFFPQQWMWELGHTALRINGLVFCSRSCWVKYEDLKTNQLEFDTRIIGDNDYENP